MFRNREVNSIILAATIIPSPTRLKENITLKFKNMKVVWHMIFFFMTSFTIPCLFWLRLSRCLEWNSLIFIPAALLMSSEFARFLYIVHNALCYVSFMNYVFCYYFHYFRMQPTRKNVCSGTCSMRGKYSLTDSLPFFFYSSHEASIGLIKLE